MSVDPVAGRDLQAAGEVAVYKNLKNGRWSIAGVKGDDNRGLLLAHADELKLTREGLSVGERTQHRNIPGTSQRRGW
jgi:hypothetical protein